MFTASFFFSAYVPARLPRRQILVVILPVMVTREAEKSYLKKKKEEKKKYVLFSLFKHLKKQKPNLFFTFSVCFVPWEMLGYKDVSYVIQGFDCVFS